MSSPTAGNFYGKRLKRLRRDRQMDQTTLAESSGVTQSYISDLEAGRKNDPGIHTFERLAVGLGLPLGVLLGIIKEPKPPADVPTKPVVRDHSPAAQVLTLAAALARKD